MKAQTLYDVREAQAQIDGKDLHSLFEVLTGDPSPAGRTPIDPAALRGQIGQWGADMDRFIAAALTEHFGAPVSLFSATSEGITRIA